MVKNRDLRSRRILIIEENRDLLEALQEMLESMDFAVESFASDLQAIATCADPEAEFDLLVTDAASSAGGGIELVDRIREHCGPIPALLLAGAGMSEALRLRAAAGEVAVLQVPFSARELEDGVASALAAREAVVLALARRSDGLARVSTESSAGSGGPGLRWALPLAAALVLVVGLAVSRIGVGPPSLPPAPDRQEMRGAVLETLEPRGDLEHAPGRFVWLGRREADEYVLSVHRSDLSLAWRHISEECFVVPPVEIAETFEPGVTYVWEVEARDASGKPLARSDRIEFRIHPARVDGGGSKENTS